MVFILFIQAEVQQSFVFMDISTTYKTGQRVHVLSSQAEGRGSISFFTLAVSDR